MKPYAKNAYMMCVCAAIKHGKANVMPLHCVEYHFPQWEVIFYATQRNRKKH